MPDGKGSMQGEFPAEDAGTPGRRKATRIDAKYPSEPPGGGEGDGNKDHGGYKGSKRGITEGD